MKERGLTLSFSLSLSLSLPPGWILWSRSFSLTNSSRVLLLSRFHKISGDVLSLVPSWLAHVLCLFSLPLSDLSVGEWQQDSSSGNTSRVLSYTIALNNPLGPKTAPVVETQVSPFFCLFHYLALFHIVFTEREQKHCVVVNFGYFCFVMVSVLGLVKVPVRVSVLKVIICCCKIILHIIKTYVEFRNNIS